MNTKKTFLEGIRTDYGRGGYLTFFFFEEDSTTTSSASAAGAGASTTSTTGSSVSAIVKLFKVMTQPNSI